MSTKLGSEYRMHLLAGAMILALAGCQTTSPTTGTSGVTYSHTMDSSR